MKTQGMFLAKSLQKAGYDTVVAAGGAEGVQLFQSGGVDLVIIDIWMPEKDGLETLMEIRRIDDASKIIAISGGGRLGLTSPLSWPLRWARNPFLRSLSAMTSFLQSFQTCWHGNIVRSGAIDMLSHSRFNNKSTNLKSSLVPGPPPCHNQDTLL